MSAPEPTMENVEGDDDAEWDDDEEDDDDIDLEAEQMAMRLRAELLADISRVTAAQAVSAPPTVTTLAPPPPSSPVATSELSKKEEAILDTMRTVLSFLERDGPARNELESSVVPALGSASVFNVLTSSVSARRVPKEVAMPLHQSIVSLARSDILFGNQRHSNASAIQLDLGKRKREQDDVGSARGKQRSYAQHYDLNSQLMEAVGIVSHTLTSSSNHPLDGPLIASIQLHLHQIFIFAVTSSPRAGLGMNALQEIGGLIQVIGVLTGIQIGQNPPPSSSQNPQFNGIGTAVYPCLTAGCQKTFARLFNLRAHQRVHAVERPHRCMHCPASFVRNHDLKRHVKLHDNKAWKCSGCDKMFSRRDAIKRHKKLSETHGAKGEACVSGDIIEVVNDDPEEGGREEKRAKMWNGIAVSVATAGVGDIEEGEIQPSVLSGLQTTVLTLHPLLQGRVSNALGVGGPPSTATPDASHATLASVIARAQAQTAPPPPQLAADAPAPDEPVEPMASADPQPSSAPEATTASLSMYGLSDEQTQMLEQAIAKAALAAQAQAEAEAALEEEDGEGEGEGEGESDDEDGDDIELVPIPGAST